MITPTVGRVVWYWPMPSQGAQPYAATVAYVHSDRMVNLSVVDHNGNQSSQTSVALRQPDEERPNGAYCEWMPYQQGQAAKTEQFEQLQKQLVSEK